MDLYVDTSDAAAQSAVVFASGYGAPAGIAQMRLLSLHRLAPVVSDEPAERVGDEPSAVVLVQVAVGRGAHCDAGGGIIRCWENGTTEGAVFATSPATPCYAAQRQPVRRGLRRRPCRSTVPLPWAGQPSSCLVTASLAAQSPEDERAIREVLLALPDAWNARDASAWVENFTPDSGFVNILGVRFSDRASNQERHETLFATIFRDSTLQAEVLHIRFTGPDTVVAEVLFRLVGYEALPPGIGETAPGVLETRLWTCCRRSTATGGSSSARIRDRTAAQGGGTVVATAIL